VFALAAAIGIFGLPLVTLYVVACAAGVGLGGVWAADRPYMLRLTPPSRIGEFYGLYGMVGRFSAITGPLIWAIVTRVTIGALGMAPSVGQGLSVLVLLVLIVVSYTILQPVTDTQRDWSNLEPGRTL
jgi:UMF1 family MFS transporter